MEDLPKEALRCVRDAGGYAETVSFGVNFDGRARCVSFEICEAFRCSGYRIRNWKLLRACVLLVFMRLGNEVLALNGTGRLRGRRQGRCVYPRIE